MNLKTVNNVFSKEKKLISAKLLTLNEKSEIHEFIFLLGYEEADFLKFRMKLDIKNIKEHIKNKQFQQQNDNIHSNFLFIEVDNF